MGLLDLGRGLLGPPWHKRMFLPNLWAAPQVQAAAAKAGADRPPGQASSRRGRGGDPE